MIGHKALILTAVLFLCPAFSFAQTGDTALKEKAYDLLESLSTQVSTLQSPENRVRIRTNIAGSIWKHDEKRARALLVAVRRDINVGLQLPENPDSQDQQTFMLFIQLRTDTIDQIAKYDPELAFDFLKTTQPSSEKWPGLVWDNERSLALRLSKQVANTSPDIALKLGRTALAQRLSEEFLPLLRPLLRKHREQGVTLYEEIVKELKAKLPEHYDLVRFAGVLAQITPPLADETAYRELIDFLFTEALKNKCDKKTGEQLSVSFCTQLGPLLGQMRGVDQRAAKLKHLLTEYEGSASNTDRSWAEVYAEANELINEHDFDGLLRLAEKYPPVRSTVYWQAFDLAQNDGDLERARQIAALFDEDPEAKQRMLARIDYAKDAAKFSDAELEDIQRQVETMSDASQRINYLVNTSIRIGVNNRAVALKLLDQATGLVEASKSSRARTAALAAIAALYCMEKSDRGFTLMEMLIPKLNELIDAAVKLNDFDTHYLRSGEWNMSPNGELGQLLIWISNNASYFAWCDFDRAVNTAAQFERPEIRMMAQLKLAQAIVAGPPKRNARNFSNILGG